MPMPRHPLHPSLLWLLAAPFAIVLFAPPVHATTRWATGVVGFSSEDDEPDYAAAQALGPPDTWPAYDDLATAWAPLTQDEQREWIELSYGAPAPINSIWAFETYNPGAIDSAYVWNPNAGHYDLVWHGAAAAGPPVAHVKAITFPLTPYPVSRIRLALNSPAVPGWNEIDAVGIGTDSLVVPTRAWASGALVSSASSGHGAAKLLGPPDDYPNPRPHDAAGSWLSATADDQREWIQLTYATPRPIFGVEVYETYNPDAVDSIYAIAHDDHALHLVYAQSPHPIDIDANLIQATFATTPYDVDGLRVTLASDHIRDFNGIDAVAILGDSLVATGGETAGVPELDAPAGAPALAAPRPDPFRVTTEVAFTLARGAFAAGPHSVTWRGTDDAGKSVAPGLYFVRLDAGGGRATRRVIRLE